ncbi:MAG TPA: type II toxin-antitoxin system VapC family toxin [Bryobacteraceae bacterium]|nr:type II toxin-antitoxin system VapC family toxin [Bryobacteraceae bacterium]
MTCLLDTHAFLWAIGDPRRLSKRADALILDSKNELMLSAVSIWEIALKVQSGKLVLPASREYFDAHLTQLGVRSVLAISPMHVYGVLDLPPVHKDPFDRLLAAQCLSERMSLISADKIFRDYGVDTIW